MWLTSHHHFPNNVTIFVKSRAHGRSHFLLHLYKVNLNTDSVEWISDVQDEVLEKCEIMEESSDNKNMIIPFFNVSTNQYDCVPILERGPCDLNHRIVVNERSSGMVHLKMQVSKPQRPSARHLENFWSLKMTVPTLVVGKFIYWSTNPVGNHILDQTNNINKLTMELIKVI